MLRLLEKGLMVMIKFDAGCGSSCVLLLNMRYNESMTGDKVSQGTRSMIRQSTTASRTAFVAARSVSLAADHDTACHDFSAEPSRRDNRGSAPRSRFESRILPAGLYESGLPGELLERAAASSSAPESSSAPAGPSLDSLRSNGRFISESLRF
jgi:hypothetical protein